MKFTVGDETDQKLVAAIEDEAAKCISAFRQFEQCAGLNVHGVKLFQKASHDAYAVFLQHLYEFYKACLVRDHGDTKWPEKTPKKSSSDILDDTFSVEAGRLVKGIISSIQNKSAPTWVNAISYYQALLSLLEEIDPVTKKKTLIPAFGTAFRDARNHHAGHATIRRGEISLLDFYQKYHGLIWLLYRNVFAWKNTSGKAIGDDFKLSP